MNKCSHIIERRLKIKGIKFKFSQKLLKKIIEHILAVEIDNEIIPIPPSAIQRKIFEIFEN